MNRWAIFMSSAQRTKTVPSFRAKPLPYPRKHGAFLESKSEGVLIDHLNRRNFTRIISSIPGISLMNTKAAAASFVERSIGPYVEA